VVPLPRQWARVKPPASAKSRTPATWPTGIAESSSICRLVSKRPPSRGCLVGPITFHSNRAHHLQNIRGNGWTGVCFGKNVLARPQSTVQRMKGFRD
jgi:hypothetical protein